MNHATTLRNLLADEISKPRPSFTLVHSYLAALREVLVVEAKNKRGGPSLDDIEDNDLDGVIEAAGVGGMTARHYRHRKAESGDQVLAALGDVASRSTFDPLAALLSSLPAVESLYPTEGREALRTTLRSMVNSRLGVVDTKPPMDTPPPAMLVSNTGKKHRRVADLPPLLTTNQDVV